MLHLIRSLSIKWKVILPVAAILLAAFAAGAYVVTDRATAAPQSMARTLLFTLAATQLGALLLVGLVIALIIHWVVEYPMARLIRTMGKVEAGDLSARAAVRTHDEVGRLRERFNHMVEQIEAKTQELARTQQQLAQSEKLASIGLLAAGVAHEINNPLAAISVAAESLGESARDERERQLARAVAEQAARISQIVRQLLSFDYPRRPDMQPGDVREVIEEALASAHVGGIRISRHYEPHVPKVLMDAHKLREAFANIVHNALEAMGERGELSVVARQQGREVEVSFTDTGPGIAHDNLQRIFDPFFTTKEVGEGTGLGLAIAYQFIKMHQGEIDVISDGREWARLEFAPSVSPGVEGAQDRAPHAAPPQAAAGARFVIRLPAAPGGGDE